MKTRIILNGCNGKMGRAISNIAAESDFAQIVAGIDLFDKNSEDYPIFSHPTAININADVIVDFSRPEAISSIVEYALEKKIALVVATTGLDTSHKKILENASAKIPVLLSGNMSLGVNLLLELVQKAAKVLCDNFDVEITEKHHNTKIDAPSGTALMIANAVNSALEEKLTYVYERESRREKRTKNELGIHSLRGGTIVGEHTVSFFGNQESIEITHTAYSREIFANGALHAAKFLAGKKPGLYSMKDVVGN